MKFQIILSLAIVFVILNQVNTQESQQNQQQEQSQEYLLKISEDFYKACKTIVGDKHTEGFMETVEKKIKKAQKNDFYQKMLLFNKESHSFINKKFEEQMKDYKMAAQSQTLLDQQQIHQIIAHKALIRNGDQDKIVQEERESKYDIVYELYEGVLGTERILSVIDKAFVEVMLNYHDSQQQGGVKGNIVETFWKSQIFVQNMGAFFKKIVLEELVKVGNETKELSNAISTFQKQVLVEIEKQQSIQQKLKEEKEEIQKLKQQKQQQEQNQEQNIDEEQQKQEEL